MAIWFLGLAALCLIVVCAIQEWQIITLGRKYVKLEEWAEDWLKRLEAKNDTQTDRVAKILVKLSDMGDDDTLLKNRTEFLMGEVDGLHEAMGDLTKEVLGIKDLLPKDSRGEILRNHVLLQQLNDEMERGLQMEKEWNEGVASILNYGKPITEVKNNE